MLLKRVLNILPPRALMRWLFVTALFLAGAVSNAGVVTNLTQTNLLAAIAHGGPVTFLADGTLTLTSTVHIATNTIIDGAGRSVILSGGGIAGTNVSTNGVRIFFVTNNAKLTLLNLTLADGRSTNGAAIFNLGTVSISNCVIAANLATGATAKDGADGKDNGNNNNIDGKDGGHGAPALGGAIYNAGTVEINRSIISGNGAGGSSGGNGGNGGNSPTFGGKAGDGGNAGAGSGGGIYNLGTLIITNSIFQFNIAGGGDGGIPGTPGGQITGSGWTGVGGQGAAGLGGGIYNRGILQINHSTFVSNSVTGGNSAQAGYMENDPDDDNGKPGGSATGGAIFNGGTANITNSTFTANETRGGNGGDVFLGTFRIGGDGGSARGGAIYNSNLVAIVNCTIATNNAFGGEGGISPAGGDYNGARGGSLGGNIFRQLGQVRLRNTILARGTNGSNYAGTVIDDGFNITSDTTPNFASGSTSRKSQDARLAALASNGGFTMTMATLTGSAAIDAGDPNFCLATDQRGTVRPQGTRCDIGAYEREPAFDILGRVTDGTNALSNVVITATSTSTNFTNAITFSGISGTNGYYTINNVLLGTYNVSAGAGYIPSNRVVQVISSSVTNINFSFTNVALSPPEISGTNGVFTFVVSSKPNYRFHLQTSTNLINWTTNSTITSTNGRHTVRSSNSIPQLFFRTMPAPPATNSGPPPPPPLP